MLAETSIVIGASTLTALVLGISIIKNAGESAFLYANARIISRTSCLIDKNRAIQLLAAKNLSDFINQLKDTEYHPFLEKIDKNSIKEFNMALEEGLINTILEMKKISPKKFQKVFDAYTKLIESKIIKTFFRSRFADIKIDEQLLVPAGSIYPALLNHLHNTKTIADMKVVLRDTEYKELFEKDYNTIGEFDLEIEKKVMKDTYEIIEKIRVYDKDAIKEVFRKKKEIKKILALLKFRIRNLDKHTQKKLVHIENVDTEKAIDAPDMKSFIDVFRSTEYEETLKKALADFEKYDDYYSFEKGLLSHYHNFIKNNDLKHNIGPYPIISYITKKEIEMKNLLIIAKGIVSGLDKEDIERMIIQ